MIGSGRGGAPPRIVFIGAVEEGRRCLAALLEMGEPVAGIITLEDHLARTLSGGAVFDDLARHHKIPLTKVGTLKSVQGIDHVRRLAPDLILVIGWTSLVPAEVLSLAPLGCVGFHASLLPKYRGRAPVNWAIINGETQTGNTMFFLDAGADTGAIIAQRRFPIEEHDTVATLYDRVAETGIQMLVEHLPQLKCGGAPRRAQDESAATVMRRRRPEDGLIDWSRGTRSLHDWVRALTHPYPGAFTTLAGRRLFVWEARPAGRGEPGPAPGAIVAAQPEGLLVRTGDGLLLVTRAQWEGSHEMTRAELAALAGRRFDAARAAA